MCNIFFNPNKATDEIVADPHKSVVFEVALCGCTMCASLCDMTHTHMTVKTTALMLVMVMSWYCAWNLLSLVYYITALMAVIYCYYCMFNSSCPSQMQQCLLLGHSTK